MELMEERQKLIDFGNKLIEFKLTKGTGGNLSIYNRGKGLIAMTPSGIPFDETTLEDIVLLDIEGNVVSGNKVPSSEWAMHCRIYQEREDVNAVIHAHTMYATVFACLRETIPASHYMIAVAGKDVRTAEYATYGTMELADNAVVGMRGRNAVLLANHGIISGAKDIENAFNIIDEVEYCAEVHYRALSIGTPIVLDDVEMSLMLQKFKTYGQVA